MVHSSARRLSRPEVVAVAVTSSPSIVSFCFALSLLSSLGSAHVLADAEGKHSDLFPEVLRAEAAARLYELGKISDADGHLERTFTSLSSLRAGNLI